jgi:AcrR family transcriptional regulator
MSSPDRRAPANEGGPSAIAARASTNAPRASTPRRSARMRPVLTLDAIVRAGTELVDERGPDALTMRAVAARLGSGVMSLYRHVPDRETLLGLVLEAMTAEIEVSEPTGEWRADLAALARDVRAALLRRPQLTVLLTARADRGGGGLATLDRALGILRAAGFEPREAALANHALGNYVAGAALWEAVGLSGETGEARQARREAAARAVSVLPPDAFPNVRWAEAELFAGSVDARFEHGLSLLLDGLEARRGAAKSTRPRGARG